MKRWIALFSILFLALISCGTPQIESAPDFANSLPTAEATAISTNTPLPSNTPEAATSTPTTLPSETPTMSLPSTATAQPLETYYLPTLISGQEVTITQIKMIDAANGWGIGEQNGSGDRLLYSFDGGNSWQERTPPIAMSPELEGQPYQIWGYFLDAQTAWVIALLQNAPPSFESPVVWRTLDRGQTWEASQPLPLTGSESFFIPENFSFIDPLQGWLLVHVDAGMSHDYSYLFATSDGGFSWQRLVDPFGEGLQSLRNTGLAMADTQFGWVTKDNLGVLPGAFFEQTQDGGLNWEQNFLPAPPEIDWFNEMSLCATSAPTFPDPQMGILLVNCRTFEEQTFSYTYRTLDQGNTWQSAQLPTPARNLIFLDNQTGWALGRDLYQSTDGGLSWVKLKTVNWDGQFSFVDEQTGWAVARADEAIALVFTQDGGLTWQELAPIIQE